MRISRHSLAIKLLLVAGSDNCRKMDDNQPQLTSIRCETVSWEPTIFYNNTDLEFRFLFMCMFDLHAFIERHGQGVVVIFSTL